MSAYIYGDKQFIELYCASGECDVTNYRLDLYDDNGNLRAEFIIPNVQLDASFGNPPPFGFFAMSRDDIEERCGCTWDMNNWFTVKLLTPNDSLVDSVQLQTLKTMYRFPNGAAAWYSSDIQASPGFSNYLAEDNK